MEHYKTQHFDIPKLDGISDGQIAEHLKLYEGYVKHTNTIFEQVNSWIKEEKTYPAAELWRRLAFEFNGMRSHEYYFGALTGGTKAFDENSELGKALINQYGSYDSWKEALIGVATTRGSGWTMLYYDKKAQEETGHPFIIGWIDEHHIGYLSSLPLVLALDCWEHAYMVDYLPGERKKYVDAYLNNLNWDVLETNFKNAIR